MAVQTPHVAPARVEFDPAAVEDLRRRIAATRHPRFAHADDGLAELLERWAAFDVDALAAELNEIEQYDVALDGVTIRAFVLRADGRARVPIVISHGWPSTVLEVLPAARRLAEPARYGGDPADALDVVVPALPGYPLSGAARDLDAYTGPGMADLWAQLMTALGYERFAASGGDIGARVTTWLGQRHPERVLGAHVSANALEQLLPDDDLDDAERAYVERFAEWGRSDAAYMHVQQTRPLTLAHGLADSPAGLAGWISEKWRGWSGPEVPDVLGHLTLFWLTNSIATSFLPYHVAHRPPGKRPRGRDVHVPVSFYLAPHDIGGIPPRRFAERQFEIAGWSELPRGGHFLATEEPDLLAADIRHAARTIWAP